MTIQYTTTEARLRELLAHLARQHGLVVHGAIDPDDEGELITVDWYAPLWMLRRAHLVTLEQARNSMLGTPVEWADEAGTHWRLYPRRSPAKTVQRLSASYLFD